MSYVYRRAEEIDREPVAPYVFREDIPHGTKKRPRPKDFDPELCGTTKGYWQHRRYGQPQCPRCAEAYSVHQREYRQRKVKEGGG